MMNKKTLSLFLIAIFVISGFSVITGIGNAVRTTNRGIITNFTEEVNTENINPVKEESDKHTQDDLFSFIHITDTHIGGWRDRSSFPVDTSLINDASADFEFMKNKILEEGNPSFVILTGDIVDYGAGIYGAECYEKFLSLVSSYNGKLYLDDSYQVPIYTSPGNHDYYYFVPQATPPYSLDNYFSYVEPRTDYTFFYNNVFFVSLDSGHDVFDRGSFLLPEGSGLTDTQISWLDEQLDALDGVDNNADTSNYRKVIFMHHPIIYFNEDNEEDGIILNNRENFLQICERYNVDLVLGGHTHRSVIYDRYGNVWNTDSTGTMFVLTASCVDHRAYRKIVVDTSGISVEGYYANPVASSIRVYIKIHRIAETDNADFEGLFMGDPDWYWHVGVLQDTNDYSWQRQTQENTMTGSSITPDITYTFGNIQTEYVYIVITLCEDDGWSSDDELADISSDTENGFSNYADNIYPVVQPPPGSFVARYYITNNTLIGDDVIRDGIYYKTSGSFDGYSGDLDASIWFEVWDNYDEIFSDHFNDMSNWIVGSDGSASWTVDNTRYYSWLYSAKCTPYSTYENDANTWIYRYIDLSDVSTPILHFFIWQDTEEYYDYIRVLVWYDNAWHEIWARSGTYAYWDEISLTIPTQSTYIAFQFYSDSSVNAEGVYIDDVILTSL